MNDWQLIQEYVSEGSETAFQTLVERHLALVHGVALRQVRDPQSAADIAQAVFILLARKAASFRNGIVLAGWLHRTTRFVAQRALRGEQRRQKRELEAVQMLQQTSEETRAPHLGPILDDALARLGERDREAILVRYAGDSTLQQVASQLGISEDAAKKRVSRAMERLRGILGATAGASMTTATLASLVAKELTTSPPRELGTRILRGVTASAIGVGSTSATLPVLVRETLNAWYWTRMKVVGGLGVGLVATAVALLAIFTPGTTTDGSAPNVKPSTILNDASVAAPPSVLPVAAMVEGQAEESSDGGLRLLVTAAESGQPIPGARLAINRVTHQGWQREFETTTDPTGWAILPVGTDVGRLDVCAWADGRAVRTVNWRPSYDDPVPEAYTLRLPSVDDTMGGQVLDADGHPVEGVLIWADFSDGGDVGGVERSRELSAFPGGVPLARTDTSGHWELRSIARGVPVNQLCARHPDHGEALIPIPGPENALWTRQLITHLPKSLVLRGTVHDAFGLPIADAVIMHGPHTFHPITARTDRTGAFSIPGMKAGNFEFTVLASGFAPRMEKTRLAEGADPITVILEPGATLSVRMVDPDGMPVPDATLILEKWGDHVGEVKWSSNSDSDGRIRWNGAPPDTEIRYVARKPGWCYARHLDLVAEDKEHVIVMHRALEVNGTVTDAATGEIIQNAKIIPGFGDGSYAWDRSVSRTAKDGFYRMVFTEARFPWRLRVEAPGYFPFTSDILSPDHPGEVDIALLPADPAQEIRGIVYQPNQEPASGATLVMTRSGIRLGLIAGQLLALNPDSIPADLLTLESDAQFNTVPGSDCEILVVGNYQGFAAQKLERGNQAVLLQLKPWGQIEITPPSDKSVRPATVTLVASIAGLEPGAIEFNHLMNRTLHNEKLRIDLVPPGRHTLRMKEASGESWDWPIPIDVKSGETTVISLNESTDY